VRQEITTNERAAAPASNASHRLPLDDTFPDGRILRFVMRSAVVIQIVRATLRGRPAQAAFRY
jgi:hypothetical protein